MEADHVVPLHVNTHQDPYDIDGCQSLCRTCHIEKTRAENRRPVSPEQRAWNDLVDQLLRGET